MTETIDWIRWSDDPATAATGVSFDLTRAEGIRAPASMFRVCAYHVDWDERPRCYVDVATLAQAKRISAQVQALCSFNVDYACAYDDTGALVVKPPW